MERPSACLLFISLLSWSCGGFLAEESKLIGSDQPILAQAGDDVILPCRLEPPSDVTDETVKWTRADSTNQDVYFFKDGRRQTQSQHPCYSDRTRPFVEELTTGNVSLKIFKVNSLDEGEFICSLPSKQKQVSIKLTLGVASSPAVDFVSDSKGGVDLRCRSGDWYPEPEVSWLDGEGHVLSAGPPETVRGPDGLYTVSSRVTVEKRHGNRFTCRVHQKTTNQTRETQIHVPDDFFRIPPSLHWLWFLIVPCLLLVVCAAVYICKLWKERGMRDERERIEREMSKAMGKFMHMLQTLEKIYIKRDPEQKEDLLDQMGKLIKKY